MCCTTRIGTGNRAGSSERIRPSAAGPPVEAATATIRIRLSGSPSAAGDGRRGTDESPLKRTTLTPAIAFTVDTRCQMASSKFGEVTPGGFSSRASAPTRRAFIETSTSCTSMVAEMMTIGVGTSLMMRLVASKPSMTGILTSMVTTSGRSRLVISTASRPFYAMPTTSICGSAPRAFSRSSRTVRESSAISTRIIGPSQDLPDGLDEVGLVEGALQEVGRGPSLHAMQPVLLGFQRGHEDDRQIPEVRGTPDRLGQGESIHARHFHVTYHQVRSLFLQDLPSLHPIGGGRHRIAFCIEDGLDQRPRRHGIVDDEQTLLRLGRLLGEGRREGLARGMAQGLGHQVGGIQDQRDP